MSPGTRDQRVEAAWQEIVAWCRVHAPVTAASLRPPAGDQAILDAERATGVSWPSELKCWYRMHDGAATLDFNAHFLPRSFPMSLGDLVKNHRSFVEVWSEFIDLAGGASVDELMAEPAGESAFIFIPAYVPFAADSGSRTLVVDTRAGEESGVVRAFDKVDADRGPAAWASLAEALEDVLATLTAQKTHSLGLRPTVEGGSLVWKS